MLSFIHVPLCQVLSRLRLYFGWHHHRCIQDTIQYALQDNAQHAAHPLALSQDLPQYRQSNNQPNRPMAGWQKWLTVIMVFIMTALSLVSCGVMYQRYLFATTPHRLDPPKHAPYQSLQALQKQGIYADKVYVKKSTQTLQLLYQDKVLRSYPIALGANPQGHKVQEGDERTPEGWYRLDWANENSIAHRSLHISYPNESDIANAKARGVSAGSNIMIHGQMNGWQALTSLNQQVNWTDGCIAVTNTQMDEIMALVKIGTPILIEW